jgi:hypothetical protein
MSPLVQETINAIIGGQEVNPALSEIITCIIAGQHDGFTEAGILKVNNPPGVLTMELADGTRWIVGAFQMNA